MLDFLDKPHAFGEREKRGDLREHVFAGVETLDGVRPVRGTECGQQHGSAIMTQELLFVGGHERAGTVLEEIDAHVLVDIAARDDVDVENLAGVEKTHPAPEPPDAEANAFIVGKDTRQSGGFYPARILASAVRRAQREARSAEKTKCLIGESNRGAVGCNPYARHSPAPDRPFGGRHCLAAEFYVNPTGNDANSGTKAAPLPSLEKARDAIRELKAGKGLPAGGVPVFLAGGEHVRAAGFELTAADSGALGKPITCRRAPGERAVISGARTITGWRKLTDEPPAVPAAARGTLFVADTEPDWWFHHFHVNGEPQQVARFPNHDRGTEWPQYRVCDHAGLQLGANAPLQHLAGKRDIEIVIWTANFWNITATGSGLNPARGVTGLSTTNTVKPQKFRPGWIQPWPASRPRCRWPSKRASRCCSNR